MVSVTHSLSATRDESGGDVSLDLLAAGLGEEDRRRLARALDMIGPLYAGRRLGTGEDMARHALGMALVVASLNLDVETRLAGLLFAVASELEHAREHLSAEFGEAVAHLVDGLKRLNGLRLVTRARASGGVEVKAQSEILRKMMLSMSEDVRVVILRLASRVQSLRYYADHPSENREEVARESLDIYAPLANRLGVWQLKWELEDMSFRFLHPDTYKRIAKMLDEKRAEREGFISSAVERVSAELAAVGIKAEVYGRPKHIYSIWNKMRGKDLDFEEVYDVRALRVLVDDVKDCYTALGIVHQLWQPISKEFDDYISHPKGNYYRSLHTAVMAEDGRSLEVQIRTYEMHRHAELGVAAHWRYKEKGSVKADSAYDDKIAWLRQLLSWRDEITDTSEWVEQYKRAAFDDTIYVLTPQGRVLDLTQGATPVDFAYRLHTDLGHRCRGARVDGQLVPLNTPLKNGQRVEIVAAKQGGPSRDWLNPQQGYLATHQAKAKVKRWFTAQEEAQTLAQGRAFIVRELQREGATQANIEELANKLGFEHSDNLYLAAGRNEVGPRQLQIALHGEEKPVEEPEVPLRKSKSGGSSGVLIVGVDKLLTQLGRCCKPAPPDAIAGYVTRGKGVSIHRLDCSNFAHMAAGAPERVISADWGEAAGHGGSAYYPVAIHVEAQDRQGLLRDISEVLSREKINVTAVNTLSKAGSARMAFTVEVSGLPQLERALQHIREVSGVMQAERA
ncbi:MAG: bifunctional (p)ppGpp synthetase/guanosine-3',5'-bis(diphosphate) 3'-pyrophosphohydrolase [Rhodocyclaceae bacterium]|nr:bifunctional (p)ppGpp synthetase/guanosine-3',5'-bis(diphosphate) 3'-pyrophosphohydrolase [Rhodocyclaceae bacterium]